MSKSEQPMVILGLFLGVESISAKSAKKYQKHIFLSFPVNFEQIGATDGHSVVFPDSGTKTVGTVLTSAG